MSNKKLRLLTTSKCFRSCKFCANNAFDLNNLPVITKLDLRLYKQISLTGGEPLLCQHLENVVRYYARMVREITVITNGLLLDSRTLETLLEWGITGITVSLDSVLPEIAQANRGLDAGKLRQVVSNVSAIATMKVGSKFRLSLNSVLSTASASVENVLSLLDFGASINVDKVRFAPLFDDGYVGSHAPHLLFSPAAEARVRDIGAAVAKRETPASNPIGFWDDLADLVAGRRLQGSACSVEDGSVLAVRGNLTFCFWVEDASLGCVSDASVQQEDRAASLYRLAAAKPNCNVGPHCFCMQPDEHTWRR